MMRRGKCEPAPTPQLVTDIPQIQECLVKTGFNPGPIDGKAGRKTKNAFRRFQEANALSDRPNGVTDKPSVDKLLEICEAPDYGLAKVLSEVIEPALAGKDTGKPVEGATITSLGPTPKLR
jgi:peptidoglycan hydrolase-like protein with peptidoglycan-binding domain